MQLTREAYILALKSPTVTIAVGDTGDQIPCPLAFLALHSEYFAKILSKPGAAIQNNGQLKLHRVSKSSVECFVHWCYQERPLALGLKEDATLEQLKDDKDTLIDLWIFTDEHNIGRLQNETMSCLRALLGIHPFLLTKDDIFNIFTRTMEQHSALRRLAMIILVAQLHTPATSTKVEDFDNMLFTGALSMLFRSMRNWSIYTAGSRTPKEKENLLLALLYEPRIIEKLTVKEDEPAGWVLSMCGISAKSLASGVETEPIEVD